MSAIGRDRLVARTAEQATRLKEGLAGIAGVTLKTPMSPDLSAGIVCFDVAGQRPPDFVFKLRDQKVVGQLDALRHVVRPARSEPRHQPRPGRPGDRGGQLPRVRLGLAHPLVEPVETAAAKAGSRPCGHLDRLDERWLSPSSRRRAPSSTNEVVATAG